MSKGTVIKMKFTKRIKIALAAGILSVGIAAASIIFASDYSTNDPLISKSYLDSVFLPRLTTYIDGKLTELKTALEATIAQSIPEEKPAEAAVNTGYEVITLSLGQQLCAKDASLDFILRPGSSAKVYSEIPSNGIADLSSGTELLSEAEIPINAYCLIPRPDGRGIVITSEVAYVMVRGSYEIK